MIIFIIRLDQIINTINHIYIQLIASDNNDYLKLASLCGAAFTNVYNENFK